jgi:retron-type reverse transcriptase
MEVSYGFRPGRSCHGALEALKETVMTGKVNYVADIDIEKFFVKSGDFQINLSLFLIKVKRHKSVFFAHFAQIQGLGEACK